MPKVFRHAGVRFEYPDDWDLEPEDHDDGWGLSVHSPGTAFATVRCYRANPPIEELAEGALAAMRAVYPELEAQTRVETVGGLPAVGHDMEFVSLDATNAAWTRCLYTDAGTLLLLCQVSDLDPAGYEAALRALVASVRIEEEEAAE